MKPIVMAATASAVLALGSGSAFADACSGRDHTGGTLLGAIAGGVLGGAVSHGNGGAVVGGALLGGLAGNAISRDMDCEDRSYAYNTYYDGFNAGRTGVPYQWRNPRSGNYGEFRVNDYYNDPVGFRCANFAQEIYIRGRPQTATGRACQQPDGTWAIVG